MSIISFPYNTPLPEKITCVICKRDIFIEDATVGPVNALGTASLLCDGHLWDDLKFVDELADYTASERQKFFDSNEYNLMLPEASR